MTSTADDESKKARKQVERWLRDQRVSASGQLRRASILGALGGCLVVPQAWLFAHAVALVVVAGASLDQALPWLWPMLTLFAARFALLQWADRTAQQASLVIKAKVRDALVRKLQALGPSYVQERSSGALVTPLVDGVEALEPYFTRFLPHLVSVGLVPLAIFLAVLPFDWISALVLLVTGPVIPVFMILIGYGTERLNQRQWRRLSRLSGRLLDTLQRLTTLKQFNAAAREGDQLARFSEDYRRSTMSVLRVAFLSSLMLEFFATVGIAVVAVLIGFRLLYGELSFETGFYALLLAPEFYGPLRQLGANYHARLEALGAATPLVDILQAEVPAPGTARPIFGAEIDIVCDGLDFAYEPGCLVLRSAHLKMEAGKVTALVGSSGAGKSTLLALILGLHRPQAGRVLVGGHDLAELDGEHWLRQVAVLPQRPHMFAGSVLDNIALGAPGVSLEEVRAAARLAEADSFISRLPLGYDTLLGEHGHTLSGGERQRIALARAFLKNASVVVMDEATTGLDPESEALVTKAIARLARERTVLIIAHRLRTVRFADRIAFMEGGHIVEEGTHEVLGSGATRYAALLARAGDA